MNILVSGFWFSPAVLEREDREPMSPRVSPRERHLRVPADGLVHLTTTVVVAHLPRMAKQTDPVVTHTPMWTLDELCAKVHVSRETVHTWRKRGTAPKAYRIGRHLMFEESDVRAWLDARTAADEPASAESAHSSGW
ncbi:helix-turn-helix transcriptional regulator [Cellulosimicrobium sp. SJTW-1]|uniref:helix-turn-helix transcriptional regulator n=1 Tax=Cellulosimicrobium sp. SJTW-1 TaxID=3078082 RepID=UPI0039EB4164